MLVKSMKMTSAGLIALVLVFMGLTGSQDYYLELFLAAALGMFLASMLMSDKPKLPPRYRG